MRFAWLLLMTPLLAACPGGGIGQCEEMKDFSGTWDFTFTPSTTKLQTVPRTAHATATLTQRKSDNFLGIGWLLWGTITSDDAGFFSSLTIPQLVMNDGSKTGALLGCRMKVNVPAAMPVHDNNEDEGPIRLTLTGRLKEAGVLISDPDESMIILVEDPNQEVRFFEWTATYRDPNAVDMGAPDAPPVFGRKPVRKRRKPDPDPPITGAVSLHLVAIDKDRRRVIVEVTGLGRAPKPNYVTFVDERKRQFVALSVDCAEPEGGVRRCELEIPTGYEKHALQKVEMHLHGLHGRTVEVKASELRDAQAEPEEAAPSE